MTFHLNHLKWRVIFVKSTSKLLVDRNGDYCYATTDPITCNIYISEYLAGSKLVIVLLHELAHAAMVSFDLLDDIHRMVMPEYWNEMEEWVCNFIANYAIEIFVIAYKALRHKAKIIS